MAEITIRFRHNPATGKRELVVHLESDSDLLPHEHERDHRAIVEALIGSKLGDDTELVVERTHKGAEGTPSAEEGAAQAEKKAEPTRS